MKKKWLKKGSAMLLTAAMVLTLFPGTKGTMRVQAAENNAPTSGYWTDVKGLKEFSLDVTSDTEGRIIFGQNGSGEAQQWKIAGTDSGIDGDNIILFAASPLGKSQFEDDYTNNKSYDSDWNCTYPDDTTVSEVFPNHYGASDLRTVLNNYMSGNSYFSASEKTKMNQTTIYTDDKKNGTTYSVTDTLYAPYGVSGDKYITVGTNDSANLKDGVKIDISKWEKNVRFWLRSPDYGFSNFALVAAPSDGVSNYIVDICYVSVVPAFNLNLSSVIFASAADAASSSYSGFKANDTDNTMTANTYTLRYKSKGTESAIISASGKKVTITNANGKYLMVQNSTGVYALAINSESKKVNASDIQMGDSDANKLENFNNCKVWIESTTDKITTAKMATQATVTTISSVEVTGVDAPVAGSALDTQAACTTTGVTTTAPTVTWKQGEDSAKGNAGYNTTYTASVTLSAGDDYEFASGVTATVDGQNATSVVKNENGTVTITYTFPVTAAKAKLISITEPTGITVANGTAYANMGLPTSVAIVTEGNTEKTAEVTWNTATPASGSYNPSVKTEQTVTLNGTVTCPDNIDSNGVALTTKIKVTISAAETPDNPKPAASTPDVKVTYRTHVQKDGWQNAVADGKVSGTSGESKRLEGININVTGNSKLGIQYSTHVQSYGWMPWSSNGEMSGTEGEAKRLEAIKIQLTGSDKDKYDIYYRVHAQSYGWLDWAKNGEATGTAGLSKRLEAIQIVVVKKGESIDTNMEGIKSAETKSYVAGNGATENPVISGANETNVEYRTHVQTYGWQMWKYNGTTAGTTGQSKRLEGINIRLANQQYAGGIEYQSHVQTYGWEKTWRKNGEISGTSGQAKRLEAIRIRLTGEMAQHYDIYYRVHSQTYGWLGWAKNGEAAGTEGHAKRLEGIQIVLVKKGEAAPGSTAHAFIK